MKKRIINLLIALGGTLSLVACTYSTDVDKNNNITNYSTKSEELNGSYKYETEYRIIEIEIDGDNALLSLDGEAAVGKINKDKRTIAFDADGETEEASYKIIGNKLSLTIDDDTFALTKNTATKTTAEKNSTLSSDSNSNKNYKYKNDFTLTNGDYEVGTDIKPGAYKVEFEFNNYDDTNKEDGTGYINISRNSNTQKYDFPNDGFEKRIILKDGDIISVVPENSDSEFSFSKD